MKTRSLVTKAMALLMASAMVMGNTGMVVHASDDGCYHGNGLENGGNDNGASVDIGGGSSDSGSSSSENYNDSGSSSSSSSDSSSSSSDYSYDDGCYHGNSLEAGGNDNNASVSIGSGSASYSAPAPKAAGKTASAGKEEFRAIAKAGAGTYKVMHKGIEVATLHLMDADKKAVACTSVALKLRDDGKYAINYDVTDATGLTVGAPVDRTYLYKTLGVSYVTINDVVVIDIEAESAK